nr:methyltransferase domain-containing protein [Sphingomonas crusticola]
MSEEATIAQLYRAVLGREPDPGGLDHYSGRLRGGESLEGILQNMLSSPEYRQRHLSFYRELLRDEVAGAAAATDERFPIDYQPPGEAGKSYRERLRSGFLARYCGGPVVLDVGFSGYDNPDRRTALSGAIGVDLDYPGYDGVTLPFADGTVDTVFSSHCLEHIPDDRAAIRDWLRVLKVGGFLVCMVPHQALYEKKRDLPSRWNADHKRMYTSATLLLAVEEALPVNSFRVRHLRENDRGFNYAVGPAIHADGAYEIELVVEKIAQPAWSLA